MRAEEKVIQLNKYLFEDIEAFFNELEVGSKGTRKMYEKDIRQFFRVYRDKELEHLTEGDLEIKKKDMIAYRKYLQDNFELANNTINNKITAVKQLYYYLSDEYDVNMKAFNFKALKTHTNPYGKISQADAEKFAQTAFVIEREKPYAKMMLILLAIRLSFRLNELLNLRWRDFKVLDNCVEVTTNVAKGQEKYSNPISFELYDQLLELKELNKKNNWKDPEIVFQISENAVNDMMKRVREHLKIPKEKNIVFHSFRGIAINLLVQENNGNLMEAAIHANHKNPATTFKHYVDKERDYTNSIGVRMDQEFSLDFIDNLTLEDFREFFKKSELRTQKELKNYYERTLEN